MPPRESDHHHIRRRFLWPSLSSVQILDILATFKRKDASIHASTDDVRTTMHVWTRAPVSGWGVAHQASPTDPRLSLQTRSSLELYSNVRTTVNTRYGVLDHGETILVDISPVLGTAASPVTPPLGQAPADLGSLFSADRNNLFYWSRRFEEATCLFWG